MNLFNSIRSKGFLTLVAVAIVAVTTVVSVLSFEIIRFPSESFSPGDQSKKQTAAAQAQITWSEPRITMSLAPGQGLQKTLSFTSDRDLPNVTVEPVPEIAGFLTSVQPGSFTNVIAGQPRSVSFSFLIPSRTAQATYDGTIHIRSGSRTLADTLKVLIDVSLQGLPPDPGEEGKVTVEGIDSDNDGVRDDIQRWIVLRYPNSEKTRTAFKQVAVDFQSTLLTANDKPASIEATRNFLRSRECVYHVLGASASNLTQIKLDLDQLRSVVLNTKLRSDAFMLSDKNFSGQVYRLLPGGGKKDACRFNVDSLPN